VPAEKLSTILGTGCTYQFYAPFALHSLDWDRGTLPGKLKVKLVVALVSIPLKAYNPFAARRGFYLSLIALS
jgi:hypothetical protein